VQPSGKSDFGIDAELQSLAASPFVPEKHATLLIERIWLNTGGGGREISPDMLFKRN